VPSLLGIVVSTDSPSIAEVAARPGVTCLQRPVELASDTAPTHPVLVHALRAFEADQGGTVDAVLLLQPTSPLRSTQDISNSIEQFISHQPADSLISCYDGSACHPEIMYRMDQGRLVPWMGAQRPPKRRQDFEPVFVRNGSIYITSRALLLDQGRIVGDTPLAHVMPRNRSVNIDEPDDLGLAEYLIAKARSS
jgi:CMP-N-acetylneuraminic acid synthetase